MKRIFFVLCFILSSQFISYAETDWGKIISSGIKTTTTVAEKIDNVYSTAKEALESEEVQSQLDSLKEATKKSQLSCEQIIDSTALTIKEALNK